MRQTTKRCACKLSHRRENKRKWRRDGSFRRFPAKNIVAKLVFVRMLLASVLQAASKEYNRVCGASAAHKVCIQLW